MSAEDDFYDGLAIRGGLCPRGHWMHDCTCPTAVSCNCPRCREAHKPPCPECGYSIPIVTDRYDGPWRWARHTKVGELTGNASDECGLSGARFVPPAVVVGVETAEEADMCRPVEVDGQIVRVRGEREMNDTARAALAEVVAAAKRELAAESNQETK